MLKLIAFIAFIVVSLVSTGQHPLSPPPGPAAASGDTRDCQSWAGDTGYGGVCTLSGYWWTCRYTAAGAACQDSHGNHW